MAERFMNRGKDTNEMKPGCDFATWVLARSQSILTGRSYSFSRSPWLKNSSNKRYVQSRTTSNSLAGTLTSALCKQISIKNCWDANVWFSSSLLMILSTFLPLWMSLLDIKVFSCAKSEACLAISVARMHPITLFLKSLNSSFVMSSVKLQHPSVRNLKVSAAWYDSYTETSLESMALYVTAFEW